MHALGNRLNLQSMVTFRWEWNTGNRETYLHSAWPLVQYAWPQVANWLFVLKYLMYTVTFLPILAAAWIRNSRSCMIPDTHLLSLWAQACWNHDSIWLSDAYIHIETQVVPDFPWDVNSTVNESWLSGTNGELFFSQVLLMYQEWIMRLCCCLN
jgi:hypothetical protein